MTSSCPGGISGPLVNSVGGGIPEGKITKKISTEASYGCPPPLQSHSAIPVSSEVEGGRGGRVLDPLAELGLSSLVPLPTPSSSPGEGM